MERKHLYNASSNEGFSNLIIFFVFLACSINLNVHCLVYTAVNLRFIIACLLLILFMPIKNAKISARMPCSKQNQKQNWYAIFTRRISLYHKYAEQYVNLYLNIVEIIYKRYMSVSPHNINNP